MNFKNGTTPLGFTGSNQQTKALSEPVISTRTDLGGPGTKNRKYNLRILFLTTVNYMV